MVCSSVCKSHVHSPPDMQASVLGQWSLVTYEAACGAGFTSRESEASDLGWGLGVCM